MKHTKLIAAVIAAAAAVSPLPRDSSVLPAPAASAADAEVTAALPDWIPNDLGSAVEFRNTYGATHIDNGLVCVVYRVEPDPAPEGEVQGILRYEMQASDPSVRMLRSTGFASPDNDYCYEIAVFDPQQACDFDIAVIDTFVGKTDPDLRDGHAIARYSFSAADDMHITETDIFSWLPDCNEEFYAYKSEHGAVSVKDNYIVFCMTSIPQFSDNWAPDSTNPYENVQFAASAFCTRESAVRYADGSIEMVYAYQAVKDGYETISWTRTSGPRPDLEEPNPYTLTADCVIFDNAQTVLLSGQFRASLADYDTGGLIPFSEGEYVSISTELTSGTPDGPSAGPILVMESNPAIVDHDLGRCCNSENFSFRLTEEKLPEGYALPGGAHECYCCSGTIVPKDGMTVSVFDNGAADVVFRLKKTEPTDLQSGQVRVTLVDADTAEPVVLQNESDTDFDFVLFRESDSGDGYVENPAVTGLKTNPSVISYADLSPERDYDFHLSLSGKVSSYYSRLRELPRITRNDNNSYEIVFRLKFTPTGDLNGDGAFSASDAELLQKWLLADPDAAPAVWKAGDFRNDNRLDAADLSLMKQALIRYTTADCVEPDELFEFGVPFRVAEDGLKLYLGPDENYPSVASIPAGTRLLERGLRKDHDTWLFTEYNGQSGWIKTVKGDGTEPTVYFEEAAKKPVIYLYPVQETDVHLELELTESDLHTTYPKYDNGWDVTAYPDGTLVNKADGSHHRSLFWDSENCRTRFDFSEGFCVAGCDTERFLKETLTFMGLNENEMNEFIVYWLPLTEHNAYNLISFQGSAYTDTAKLNITPAPDSECRIFMAYIPLEEAVQIRPQQLEAFERTGFAVIEWGGAEVRQ